MTLLLQGLDGSIKELHQVIEYKEVMDGIFKVRHAGMDGYDWYNNYQVIGETVPADLDLE